MLLSFFKSVDCVFGSVDATPLISLSSTVEFELQRGRETFGRPSSSPLPKMFVVLLKRGASDWLPGLSMIFLLLLLVLFLFFTAGEWGLGIGEFYMGLSTLVRTVQHILF